MPKATSKKAVERRTARVRQAHATPIVRPTKAVVRQANHQRSGFAGFIHEFPLLSGILTVAILASLFAIVYNNHLGPFAPHITPDPCAWAKQSSSPAAKGATIVRHYNAAPNTCIQGSTQGLYQATIHTSKGDVVVLLDQTQAPIAVNNFVFLASHHFYDGLDFTVQTSELIKGGDLRSLNPKHGDLSQLVLDHSDGPGYFIPEETPSASAINPYRKGRILMDNEGQANTTGSRFMLTTADATSLQPKYSYFGSLTTQSLPIAQSLKVGDAILWITIQFDPKGLPGVPSTPPTPAGK